MEKNKANGEAQSFRTSDGKPAKFLIVVALLVALAAPACKSKETAVRNSNGGPVSAARSDVKKGITPQPDEQVAVITTADYGQIVIELYPNVAPQMVKRFKQLIQEGFYNGTAFHRISAGRLIQGGDPFSKDDDPENDGTGESNHANVPGEFSDIPFERGTVGAARHGATPEFAGRAAVTEAQARNTANCQFFITLRRERQYDENYTVFGKVIDGITNVETIAGAPVEVGTERPTEKITVKTVTLEARAKYSGQ